MIVFIISALILALDQLSKFLINLNFLPGQSYPVIRNVFHLTLVHNTGAAFGLFAGKAVFFILISVTAIILILVALKKTAGGSALLKVGLAMILGGAIGNLIDRVRLGFVVDFLDFRIWPVFNLADTTITLGAGLLAVYIFRRKGEPNSLPDRPA